MVWAYCAFAVPVQRQTRAQHFRVFDTFVLGDSQFAFGAGPAFHKFFTDLAMSCGNFEAEKGLAAEIGEMNVGVMGVRSTFHFSWIAHKWVRKKIVCEPGPKRMVNTRLYGWPERTNGTIVQLGKPGDLEFFRPGKSAIEAIIDYQQRQKLFVMLFKGNAPRHTGRDVKKLMQQLPSGTPCVIMTTVPSYSKKSNELRKRSQLGSRKAFENMDLHVSLYRIMHRSR